MWTYCGLRGLVKKLGMFIVLASLGAACASSPEPRKEGEAKVHTAEAPVEIAADKVEPADEDAGLPGSCQELFRCYRAVADKVPEAARNAFLAAMEQTRKALQTSPEPERESTCRLVLEQTSKAMSGNPMWPADCKPPQP